MSLILSVSNLLNNGDEGASNSENVMIRKALF